MSYDTVVFDLDGILLKDGMMTSNGKEAVEKLLNHGFHVIYSSGKNYWYTAGGLSFSNLLRDDTIIMAENGGIIFFPFNREMVTFGCEKNDVAEVSREFIKRHCHYENGNLVLREPRTPLWQEPKETIFTLFPMDLSTIPTIKQYLEAIISERGLDLYAIDHSDAVDTVSMGQHKGTALEYLCENSIINLRDTVAFGDGNNDKEMLETVGLPITVDNANDDIKELVREKGGIITAGAYGAGVLEAVELLVSGEL